MKNGKTSWVKAGDEWIDIDRTEFVDISEGLHGDEYTFTFEEKEYTSVIIIGGSQPG